MQTSRYLIGVAIIVGAVAHRPILQAPASALIVDQGRAITCTHVVILGGDQRYDIAAELIQDDPARKVVHLGSKYSRLVEYSVLPPREDHFKQQLQERGVSEEVIVFRGATLDNSWETVAELNRWLHKQADARVVVFCDRFGSRCLRYQLDTILAQEDAARVSLSALRDRRYSELDWWRSRRGLKQFVHAWLDLGATWWFGPEGEVSDLPRWEPDQYEMALNSPRPMVGNR